MSTGFPPAVQMVFQDPYGSLNPRQTVDRILAKPLAIHGFTNAETRIEPALLVGLGVNKFGLRVDCSHTGRRCGLDIMAASSQPGIFSHANPLALAEHGRHITDEQIKSCRGEQVCSALAQAWRASRLISASRQRIQTRALRAALRAALNARVCLAAATPGPAGARGVCKISRLPASAFAGVPSATEKFR